MKLLFYVHAICGGGAERVMTILMNTYAERGYEVSVATNTTFKPAYILHPNIKMLNLMESIPKVESTIFDKIKRYHQILLNARKIAKSEKPDVAISFNTSLNHDVILALLGTGIPLICSEHTNILYNHGAKTMIMRKILYPFADAITVLTKHDYHIWKHHKNVVYMPNPITPHNPILNVNRQKIVLTAGRLDSWKVKGFDTLIRCWSQVCKDFPDWELHIAGNGNNESIRFLENLIAQYSATNIKLLGFCDNMYEVMTTSEIYCLTSRREGLPMVLLEAMDAGCCCIAFDCVTGPSDIITNNINGVLVDNQNEDKFVSSLRNLLMSKDIRKRLSSRAINSVSRFSIERICHRWDILFSKLIRK